MSELIAEARVLVTPDTTAFRPLLVKQLATATAGLVVPIPVAPVVTGSASTAAVAAAQKELATSANQATVALARQQEVLAASAVSQREAQLVARGGVILATQQERALAAVATEEVRGAAAAKAAAAALTDETVARRAATASAAAHQRALSGLTRGAGASALSMVGLRGATLASTAPFLAGAAAIITFAASLKTAANFETSLNVFQATAGATADQMERISKVSKDLGADLTLPGVTANSAADALSGLARAGLSVEDSISGVRGVLQLATAAAISNEDAVNIVASGLNAFSLSGKDAARVADLLAASSKESQGSITDVGLALQQSAAAAAQAGVSVEDTIALLTELGRAGLRGSDAGTSLRVALLRLIAPTNQAKEALDGLGVAIRDESGNVRPEAFTEITKALSGFTKAQQDATLALIFGQDAFRAASIIGREGAAGLDRTRDSTQQVGVAAELAAARTQGLAGSMENLKNQVSTLGLSLGQGLSTPLQDFANIVAGGVQNINDFVGWLGRIGQEAPRTEESVAGLADEFARLNREAGGSGSLDAAATRVSDLGRPAAIAVLDYAELTKKLGKLSFALQSLKDQGASLDTPGAKRLASDIADLIVELNATEPAGLKAASGIEAVRSSISATGLALQRLKHAIEPPKGFLPKQPVVPDTGPKAVGPDVIRQARIQVAQSRGDLAEVARLQQLVLDDANRAVENGIHKTRDARIKLVQAQAAAQAALNQTRSQIASQTAADAKTAATEAARAQQEADQAVLDSFSGGQNRISLAQISANATARLNDDVKLQTLIITTAEREKQIIFKTVDDQKTKNTQIAARVQTIKAARLERDRLEQEIADTATQRAQDAFQAQVDLAAAQGNIPAQIRFIELRIRAIDKLIAAGETEGAALNRLKTEREQLRQQREDVQNQQIQDQIALGQSIEDLTGNKNPLVTALNKAIAETRQDITAAQNAGKSTVVLRTELNNFLAQKKRVLDEAKQATTGFTGFEFLQKTQGFASNLLGNLIPGFATAGLVGNTSSAAAQGRITDPRDQFGGDTVTGNIRNANRGVRPVQVDTTNALLRQILGAVSGRHTNPPEIKQNWRTAFAELDTL